MVGHKMWVVITWFGWSLTDEEWQKIWNKNMVDEY